MEIRWISSYLYLNYQFWINTHCLTPESKVSSCFIIPVLPLRISSKHSIDISFSKRKISLLQDFGSSPGARTNYHHVHPSSQGILPLLSHLRSSRFHAVACTNPLFSYPYSHVSVRGPQVLSYLLPMLPASFSPCVSKPSSTS